MGEKQKREKPYSADETVDVIRGLYIASIVHFRRMLEKKNGGSVAPPSAAEVRIAYVTDPLIRQFSDNFIKGLANIATMVNPFGSQ